MRLAEIRSARDRYSNAVQPLPEGDFSASVGVQFGIRGKDDFVRNLKRKVAGLGLALLQGRARREANVSLPFKADLITIGERFAEDAAWSYMLRRLPPAYGISALIPGCYMGGEDVQFWLRRGIARLEGIDVYALTENWSSIVPKVREKWGVPTTFRQGSIENIPFDDCTFDVTATAAVLEHVRNLKAMAAETARVLKPGGFALHSIGPLYYCYGADHCIGAYGLEAGYDHLLLDEETYRKRVNDREFFRTASGNPDLGFWAVNDQFSFATADEYLAAFKRHFDIALNIVKISSEGLEYRRQFPGNWKQLLGAGVPECDLLVKGLAVVLRKPQ